MFTNAILSIKKMRLERKKKKNMNEAIWISKKVLVDCVHLDGILHILNVDLKG